MGTEGQKLRRRRRKRRARRTFIESEDASGGRENVKPGAIGSDRLLYSLEGTTDWAGREDTGLDMPISEMGEPAAVALQCPV